MDTTSVQTFVTTTLADVGLKILAALAFGSSGAGSSAGSSD